MALIEKLAEQIRSARKVTSVSMVAVSPETAEAMEAEAMGAPGTYASPSSDRDEGPGYWGRVDGVPVYVRPDQTLPMLIMGVG